jgi:hypothetical protein
MAQNEAPLPAPNSAQRFFGSHGECVLELRPIYIRVASDERLDVNRLHRASIIPEEHPGHLLPRNALALKGPEAG